ncbi:hypothetical protein D3C72_2181770 [compost metagenome]
MLRATSRAPIVPAAPARDSITSGWPSSVLISGVSMRPNVSVVDPGWCGTTMRTGWVGKSPAARAAGLQTSIAASKGK